MRVLVLRRSRVRKPWNAYRSVEPAPPRTRHCLIISGGARGTNTMAEWWAQGIGVRCDVYEADWISLDRKAGPIRNQRTLEARPCDGFPGGRGTADIVRRGKEAE